MIFNLPVRIKDVTPHFKLGSRIYIYWPKAKSLAKYLVVKERLVLLESAQNNNLYNVYDNEITSNSGDNTVDIVLATKRNLKTLKLEEV